MHKDDYDYLKTLLDNALLAADFDSNDEAITAWQDLAYEALRIAGFPTDKEN